MRRYYGHSYHRQLGIIIASSYLHSRNFSLYTTDRHCKSQLHNLVKEFIKFCFCNIKMLHFVLLKCLWRLYFELFFINTQLYSSDWPKLLKYNVFSILLILGSMLLGSCNFSPSPRWTVTTHHLFSGKSHQRKNGMLIKDKIQVSRQSLAISWSKALKKWTNFARQSST